VFCVFRFENELFLAFCRIPPAEEVDFPRGGASALSPLEVRRIKHEAEKDVLFGVSINTFIAGI